tara:strand:- start:1069 stop:1494 length:426 start_codon:yes stop_codon:yes gene_type:complete
MILGRWNAGTVLFIAHLLKGALVVVNAAFWNTLFILALLRSILTIAIDETAWRALPCRLVAVRLRLNTVFSAFTRTRNLTVAFHAFCIRWTIRIGAAWLNATCRLAYQFTRALVVLGTAGCAHLQVVTTHLSVRTFSIRLT